MKKLTVVSICFEAMLAQKFHIYAGGLGVVQSALLKSGGRSDWPVNLYGLGTLWKQGYYDQRIGPEGMIVDYVTRNYNDILEDTGVRVSVDINGRPNFIKVWYLRPEIFKTVPTYFLDTDIEENDELARSITKRLYGGTEETRLAQEIVKGIGGVRAFEALGISVDLYHGQEGHSLLIAIELLRRNLKAGMTLKNALWATARKFVFTTHTPEIAGNETHNLDLMIKMGCFPEIPREIVLSLGGENFNMTMAALRLARKANAVAKLHWDTTNRMWNGINGGCPIVYITNGIDLDWQFPEFAKASSPSELQKVKAEHKNTLIQYIKKRTGKVFRENVPIVVWARRFTDYKRPWLLFMDWPWLERLLWNDKLQLIIAGKPHPHDLRAINIFNDIYKKSLKVPNLAVLAGYEYYQSKVLKAGTDLWLQTSRRPREACGTSWISANYNGAIVISSRDGGILESPEECHFLFGVDSPCTGEGEQDTKDYRDLIRVLEEAMEIYYHDKSQWYSKALAAKQAAEKDFNADRMFKEYIDLMYLESSQKQST